LLSSALKLPGMFRDFLSTQEDSAPIGRGDRRALYRETLGVPEEIYSQPACFLIDLNVSTSAAFRVALTPIPEAALAAKVGALSWRL